SASIEWAKNRDEPDAWERWWKDESCRQYYFIGKDNIPFHTVIWPAILIARGDTILPYDVPANEYMNFGGQKASKSAGVGTTVPDLLKAFDPDPIRFYLTVNAPENSDSDFSADELIRRNNDELVNLINALKMLCAPFLPFTSGRQHGLVGYEDGLKAHGWRWEPLAAGHALPKPSPLFVKIAPAAFAEA